MNHFNQLTPAEDERLALLLEELGEAVQAIGKIQRHGYGSHDPTKLVPEDQYPETNRQMLEKELGDVLHAIDRMAFSVDVNFDRITDRADAKIERVQKYLHHQHATGYYKSRRKPAASHTPTLEEL